MPQAIHYERLIIGYHGCDKAVAEDVLLNGASLKLSENQYDWLGQGIYFWEYGPKRAMDWAVFQKTRGKVNEPCVLGAFIHLRRCFDLTDTTATDMLAAWHGRLKQAEDAGSIRLPENKRAADGADLLLRYLDCFVFNWGLKELADAGHGYQTVRGVFVEGPPAYAGSGVMTKTHVQVAVRDPACILGFFRPTD